MARETADEMLREAATLAKITPPLVFHNAAMFLGYVREYPCCVECRRPFGPERFMEGLCVEGALCSDCF